MLATALLARGFPPSRATTTITTAPILSKPDVCLITSIDVMPCAPRTSEHPLAGLCMSPLSTIASTTTVNLRGLSSLFIRHSFIGSSHKVGRVGEASEFFLHSLRKHC